MSMQEKLKQCKQDLNDGYILVVKCSSGDLATCRKNGRYIAFKRFGGSAIKNNLKDIKWLFVDFFKSNFNYEKMNIDDFYNYQIKTNYSVLMP